MGLRWQHDARSAEQRHRHVVWSARKYARSAAADGFLRDLSQHPWRVVLGQYRPEDRRDQYHDQHGVEHATVEQCLAGRKGPVVASTDYIKLFAEQIRPFVKNTYITLGTDGFGRSDTREKLRHHFEVDRHWVTLAALKALADEGKIEREKVAAALVKYNLDPAKPNPMSV